MMGRVGGAVLLVIVWVALWGEVSWANVIGGVVAAIAIRALFPVRAPDDVTFRLFPALWFTVYFLGKLVEASAVVAWETVTPRNRINAGIIAVPVRGVSEVVVTIVANAISLTPGTLTVEVQRRPTVLYVHVLHLRDVEEARRQVLHLEDLANRAFGPVRDDVDRSGRGDARRLTDAEIEEEWDR